VNAVAVTRRRSRFDRYQSHGVFPFVFVQDTTRPAGFSQDPEERIRAAGMFFNPPSIGRAGTACQCFPAIPSKAWTAW
jgi:hypothetical protein